jgi:hypothetical protein
MRNMSLLSLFFVCFGISTAHSAEVPKSFVDFDRQVAFSKPLLISIFHGYNDDHVYYVLPNIIKVGELSPGVPDLSLIYDQVKRRHAALLTIRGQIGFSGDYEAALAEIKSVDPVATFAIPEPYAFSFAVSTPGADGGGAIIDAAKINSAGRFELLAKVSDITARILLLPTSYKFDSMSIVYSPVYHGVVRTSDGTPQIVERKYDVSVVSNGGCVFSPDRYLSWATQFTGCIFPRYDRKLVYSIQKQLRKLGLLGFQVDGVYGPHTGAAIKRYQTSKGAMADGIPTLELAEQLAKETIGPPPPAHQKQESFSPKARHLGRAVPVPTRGVESRRTMTDSSSWFATRIRQTE